jgi:hypothetical protein
MTRRTCDRTLDVLKGRVLANELDVAFKTSRPRGARAIKRCTSEAEPRLACSSVWGEASLGVEREG